MIEIVTIKGIKALMKRNGLRIGDKTAKEIKTYANREPEISPERHIEMISQNTKFAKRKTVKPVDVEQHRNLLELSKMGKSNRK